MKISVFSSDCGQASVNSETVHESIKNLIVVSSHCVSSLFVLAKYIYLLRKNLLTSCPHFSLYNISLLLWT